MKVSEAKDMEIIKAMAHDITLDTAGYFLIRLKEANLEVGFCRENNVIEKLFRGSKAEHVYHAILKDVDISKEHAAYLGKELEKTEICRNLGKRYVQDEPLK